jgi:hypothetical protein
MRNNLKFIYSFIFRVILITFVFFLFYAVSLHIVGGGNLVYYRGIWVSFLIFGLFLVTLLFIKSNFDHNFPALCLATVMVY